MVGNKNQKSDPAGDSGPAACIEIFLMSCAGLSQMHMYIYKPRKSLKRHNIFSLTLPLKTTKLYCLFLFSGRNDGFCHIIRHNVVTQKFHGE